MPSFFETNFNYLFFVPREAFAIITSDNAVLDMAKMLSYSLLQGIVTRISLCYLAGYVTAVPRMIYFLMGSWKKRKV